MEDPADTPELQSALVRTPCRTPQVKTKEQHHHPSGTRHGSEIQSEQALSSHTKRTLDHSAVSNKSAPAEFHKRSATTPLAPQGSPMQLQGSLMPPPTSAPRVRATPEAKSQARLVEKGTHKAANFRNSAPKQSSNEPNGVISFMQ